MSQYYYLEGQRPIVLGNLRPLESMKSFVTMQNTIVLFTAYIPSSINLKYSWFSALKSEVTFTCIFFYADGGDMNRIGTACSKNDIVVFQGPTAPLPNGIPAYTVQILNVCVSGCSISNIHISCGWFSSVHLINPRVFRRMYYDDCLVNDGEALGPGETLSFQYANSFPYRLKVASVACCWSTKLGTVTWSQ